MSHAIELGGRVDFNMVPDLRKRLMKVVKNRAHHTVELDFSHVTHVDTSGIAMLVELSRLATSNAGELRLKGLSEQARKMIRLARLDQIFILDDD